MVLYRQVLDLYATSVDYDPRAEASADFFNACRSSRHVFAQAGLLSVAVKGRGQAALRNMLCPLEKEHQSYE